MIGKLAGESLGAALLVFVIGAAALAAAGLSGMSFQAIIVGLASGLALAILYHFFSPVSGGHFNPAVTLGLASAGRFPFQEAVPYIVAQTFGALAGATLLYLANAGVLHADMASISQGYGIRSPGGFGALVVFAAEAVATSLFVATYLAATHKRARPGLAALVIGLSYGLFQALLAHVSFGVLNPARAVAMAVFLPDWAGSPVWLFIAAGVVGGVLGGIGWGRYLEEDFLRKAE